LQIVEPEFSRVLRVMERESNTLSAIVRESFDSGDLNTLTKKQPAKATGAHISLIGHITRDELRRELTDTSAANGLANRMLWLCCRRSKLLPDGGDLDSVDFSQIIARLEAAAKYARRVGEMHRDKEARAIWHAVYESLSEGKPGLFGAITSRADCLAVRLSMIYALLDQSPIIKAAHLKAALAVWRYCEDSARFVFGDALGDETADEILRQLRSRPDGMTRTEIRDLFQRNRSAAEIGRALGVLQEHGLARMTLDYEQEDNIRQTERWRAITVSEAKQ
jgi:DNA-binding transcriptional ArsR family regulator